MSSLMVSLNKHPYQQKHSHRFTFLFVHTHVCICSFHWTSFDMRCVPHLFGLSTSSSTAETSINVSVCVLHRWPVAATIFTCCKLIENQVMACKWIFGLWSVYVYKHKICEQCTRRNFPHEWQMIWPTGIPHTPRQREGKRIQEEERERALGREIKKRER